MQRLRMRAGKTIKAYLYRTAFNVIKILCILYLFSLIMMIFMLIISGAGYLCYIACAASFAAFIISLLWMYKKLYLPFKGTEQALRNYNLGYNSNAPNEINVFYTEELERTFSKFFSLFESMNAIKLTNTNAEYRALQNQINPHFLYNTLEAIRSDALSEGSENIANITEALAMFFRYTISNVNSMVTLEAELNNSENYFAIQNFRFRDKINLKINIDDEDMSILEYEIPKLTLQPIIENAIIHGLENKVGRGTIEIDITATEDRLIIKVTDDGVGMDEEVLNSINERLHEISGQGLMPDNTEKGGIALINVNNRIKLQFGEKYGLRIYSIKGLGTSVEVTLPHMNEKNG
ncbi:MAG TPA: sensor histidine kinase [Clostridia bacterium]|nr:sensor histidine kinase [Clostridia bacterium]